ncbi:MAG TPA: hypothetical protein ENG51_08605 [Deltaproteobacteria bacterium]|nr:hypothetical protein [Deltaproteobacteria bacterium]
MAHSRIEKWQPIADTPATSPGALLPSGNNSAHYIVASGLLIAAMTFTSCPLEKFAPWANMNTPLLKEAA